MTFQLQSIDRPRLSASIVEQLVAGIESGAFPPGRALPAERMLAARLGVSRSSVREAIRVLEHAGILDVRTGSGTYVVDTGSAKVATLRAQAVLTGEHSPLDVMAARRAVEPTCAEIAAAQHHERDLALIHAAIAAQGQLIEAGADASGADLDFHLAVAGATHNPVLLLLVERLAEIMRRRPWTDLKQSSRTDGAGARRDVRQHTAVLSAIERANGGAAARAMRTHLSSVERDLIAHVIS
jgi:GntR family transcriptional repressor for pyruvate dehydrogenase complex